MIPEESRLFKKIGLWSFLIICAFVSAFILFISIISIWVGFSSMPRHGFWAPILAGTASMTIIFLFFARLIRFFRNQTKEKSLLGPD